ncbi:hypothetical protein ZWY2020_029684 [Hordeum vulgare]|nr:hypothetical protein ZWY2020_029684 [Hordeum vulgare]
MRHLDCVGEGGCHPCLRRGSPGCPSQASLRGSAGGVVVQAPSWAEVAARARPRLRSIIVDPAALTPPPPQRQLCTRGARHSGCVSPAAAPARPRSRVDPSNGGWEIAVSRHSRRQARRQALPLPQQAEHPRHLNERGAAAAQAFKKRFGNCCFRCLGSRHKSFECRDPFICYTCKRTGHRERVCLVRLARPSTKVTALAPLAPRPPKLPSRSPPLHCAARPTNPPQPHTAPPKKAPVETVMDFVPGAPRQRPAKSSCMVVSTPLMQEEAYRLRTTALLLTAMSACPGISPDMVVDVLQCNHRFRLGDIEVAPCFPEDFILTLAERFQRDLAFEARYVEVAGVKFQLRPWFPPPGGHKIWRYYYRMAIDRLPLNAWDWDNVQQVIGQNCKLDLTERQSTSRRNRSALFAWLWTWNPDMIPRAADFTVLSRPDYIRSKESLPEGAPVEEGKEGPFSRCSFTWMR